MSRVRLHADRVAEVAPGAASGHATTATGTAAAGPAPSGGGRFTPKVRIIDDASVRPLPIAGLADDFTRTSMLLFEMTRVTPAVANMLRRVIITEVPTMAFDRVVIHRNDSVVLDEMLSHRLGLLPIAVDDIDRFDMITEPVNDYLNQPLGRHVLKFTLDVEAAANTPITCVYSGDLKWVPLAGQESRGPYRPVHDKILLAKLGPGQGISLEVFAVKGIGLLHNKWSPVSTCWYDMRTVVSMKQLLTDPAQAQRLKELCPKKVFGVDPKTKQATVVNPEACTVCRECLRQPEKFEDYVEITKRTDEVVFHVESLGQYPNPAAVVRAALRAFADRCRSLAKDVEAAKLSPLSGGAAVAIGTEDGDTAEVAVSSD